MAYDGPERRASARCLLHEGIVKDIEQEREDRQLGRQERREDTKLIFAKLDALLERQNENHEQIMHVKAIVSNGLQEKVAGACQAMEILAKDLGARMAIQEEVGKFVKPLMKARDNLFMTLLTVALFGGIVYAVIHWGNKLVTKVTG